KLLMAFLFVALVSILVLGCGSLFAADKSEAAKPAKKEKSVSAMKVGKDPELRPVSKAEDKILTDRLNKTLEKYPALQVQTRKDGTKSLVVAPQFLNFNVATVGKDGKVSYSCTKVQKKSADAKPTQAKSQQSQPEE
ncbi:MAG TPA: hypothetical protein VLH08_11925, partial [Acidobacteriota bacterium]|nr:hypothetical protein [Acidobacteriota bacterium]